MMQTPPSWDFYRSCLGGVDERSRSGAARTLSSTQPTIGRHIAALEQALDVVLFTRSPTGLRPTEAASALVPHAQAMASAAGALERVASGEAEDERGAVRITASEMVANEVLPSCLAAFREAHPGVVVELVVSNRNEDLLRRDADIAVRMVRPTQGALLARKIGVIHLGLHAHPRYIEKHGLPRTPAEIHRHPLIGFDKQPSVRRLDKLGLALSRELFAFRCDSDLGQYAALRAGFGLGLCQLGLARRDGLVRVLESSVRLNLDVWLVMHRDLAQSRRVRLMYDHLAEHLRAYIAGQGG
jgi:DNA-binding transcriptional LysR family regulator